MLRLLPYPNKQELKPEDVKSPPPVALVSEKLAFVQGRWRDLARSSYLGCICACTQISRGVSLRPGCFS